MSMLDWEARMEIKDLHRQGYSMRHVTRLTGHSRNTVKRVLHPVEKVCGRRGRKSKVAPFADYLRERYLATELSGVRLCEEIRQMGYTGAVDAVQRFLQSLDVPGRAMERATVRYETASGEQAQVDWADVGSFLDETGIRRKVYAFVMILGFSRMLYVEFTTSMKLEQLLACHQRAFEYFGGFPRRILYDNMKQVRLGASEWNPLIQDFLRHYNIAPPTCRPYRPRTKGKVERSIRYLKDNFLKGRQFADLSDLQAQAFHWQAEAANVRIHATTGRRRRNCLLPNNWFRSLLFPLTVWRKTISGRLTLKASSAWRAAVIRCRRKRSDRKSSSSLASSACACVSAQ